MTPKCFWIKSMATLRLLSLSMYLWAHELNIKILHLSIYKIYIVPPQIQEESSRQLKRGAVTYTILYTWYFFWSFNLPVTPHSTHLSNTSPTNTGFESLLSYAPGAMKFTIWLWVALSTHCTNATHSRPCNFCFSLGRVEISKLTNKWVGLGMSVFCYLTWGWVGLGKTSGWGSCFWPTA